MHAEGTHETHPETTAKRFLFERLQCGKILQYK